MELEWESLLIDPEGDSTYLKAITKYAFYFKEKIASSKADCKHP